MRSLIGKAKWKWIGTKLIRGILFLLMPAESGIAQIQIAADEMQRQSLDEEQRTLEARWKLRREQEARAHRRYL